MSDNNDYIIVTSQRTPPTPGGSHEALMISVNEKLAEGYKPLGAPFYQERIMFQAMFRGQDSN